MRHMDKTLSPPSKPPRVSVPLSGDVLLVFERLAKAGNVSTGRAIAEWLSDTSEAAEFMAHTLEQARAAPKAAIREMHAYALAVADETGSMMERIKAKGVADRASVTANAGARDRAAAFPSPIPPSCNTGGKVPARAHRKSSGGSL